MSRTASRPDASTKNETGDISNFERFTRFVRAVVNVPGSKVKEQIAAEKKARAQKRAKSSSGPASRAKD
jgi:hypothetical protein